MDMLLNEVGRCSGKWQLPAEKDVCDHTKTINVGSAVERLATALLGRHIGRSSYRAASQSPCPHTGPLRYGDCFQSFCGRGIVRVFRLCARRWIRHFRDSEVEHLGGEAVPPIRFKPNVFWLEIPMNDPGVMSG